MSLKGVAAETLSILERGSYTAPSGQIVALRGAVDAAVAGTVLHRPEEHEPLLLARARDGGDAALAEIQVVAESTGQAARRLVEGEGIARVCALNFASAKNAGGGFINGAKAQEEDLARCSALYPCLRGQRAFYDANRASSSFLYTDHILYSPDVPFFRDESLKLLEAPFAVSILTAPAPNAGEALRRDPGAREEIRAALEFRAGKVLAVAAHHGHRTLILGAWGCGVFRNDPGEVAHAFGQWLRGPFRGAFERVVFAIYDRSPERATLRAFESEFG